MLLAFSCASPASLPTLEVPATSPSGTGSTAPTEGSDPPSTAAATYAPRAFARLTTRQYRNLLWDLLGPVSPIPLQEDTYPYLFASVGASTDALSEQGVQMIEEGTNLVAGEVFADPVRRLALVGCEPTSAEDPCVQGFLQRWGRRAWRRPLTDVELARWTAVVAREGDLWLGLQSAVAGLLQSPWAIYRVELGVPDPSGWTTLTPYEYATRLALVLWDTVPDEALLDAAERGALDTPEGRQEQVTRLLADPRSEAALTRFFEQYLDLGRLSRAAPDPGTYPTFTESLREAMRQEVLLLVDEVINRRRGDARSLFSARRAYVNRELADHYGLDAPGATAVTFVPVDLPADSPRAGLPGLGAFLTMNAHAIDTSPTLRGKYLLERVLCSVVPPPPDDADLDLSPTEGAPPTTLRDRLEQHVANPECAGCHALMDPPGFLFEHFDATGRWRELDQGFPIDTTGNLLGAELAGSGDLGEVLANHPSVGPCMVQQLYRHAHGRLDQPEDRAHLDRLAAAFQASGHDFRALLRDLVLDDSFRTLAPGEAP